jgi:hypothetical protein
MMAALILVFSVAALLQFFVSYCRSVLAASAKEPLSLQARDVTGIKGMTAPAGEFPRFLQLLELCPERPEDRGPVRAVRAYYRMLGAMRVAFAWMVPSLATWTEAERGQCAYFAAVVLDRRIAFSRDLFAQQMGDAP